MDYSHVALFAIGLWLGSAGTLDALPTSPASSALEPLIYEAKTKPELTLKSAKGAGNEQEAPGEVVAIAPVLGSAAPPLDPEQEQPAIVQRQTQAIAQISSASNQYTVSDQSTVSEPTASDQPSPTAEQLNLDPQVVEDSPVLQRWLDEIPDVLSDIRHEPSFRTRLRLGYSYFPSTDQSGFNVGVEDLFLGQTGLTLSGDYQQTFDGDRQSYGGDLRYYVRPLGSYINVAPVVGYRYLDTEDYTTEGVNVGLRLMLALSRTGAADISLTQSWVAPGTDEEVGITALSLGYALTQDLRLSTDLQRQNAGQGKDSRFGIVLEWML